MTSLPLFYREIPLTQGQVAIVDALDYEWLMQWKWHAWWNEITRSFYAKRNYINPDGKYRTISMQMIILGLEPGDKRKGDHINRETLDNRRANLRIATPSENGRNCTKSLRNTSGYKGVTYKKKDKKWAPQICVNYKRIYIGLFDSAEEAYAAYCEAAKIHHGEFARFE